MDLKPIKTEKDYRSSLERLEEIFDAQTGTSESDELEILSLMIDDYENKHYAIDAPDPIEAIKIRMEEMKLRQVDLIPEIGGRSRVSEILNKKRRLTVDMIRKLAVKLNISPNILIGEYQLVQ